MPPETLGFSAEVAKVLHLMIHSLYTNKDIFLRELVSNASDACDKLRYEAVLKPELLGDTPALGITLSLDKDKKTVTVTDNGIGMNKQELISNLGTIARSGTQEFIKSLGEGDRKEAVQIGQFGVGFYSAFIVADNITVISRKAGEDTAHAWESDGVGQFKVTPLEGSHPRGTSIILHIRDDAAEYLDKHRLKYIVQTYSDHISFPIRFKDSDATEETFNSAAALWARPKQEITDAQYIEFYHHVAHSPDTPWMTLHNKNEGALEYTNLLFIPSIQPFDLFHPDRKRRVKLYVKRVFITDEGTDLVPHYLRFLRGIIDSEDLPLNISRESLQKNTILDRIRDSAVKRVLGELKKHADKSPEDYATFWNNFGAVLKEGLCEAMSPKEQILEACRFFSSTENKLVSLDDYITRMKPGQEHIFYLTGDHVEKLKLSPQIEGFNKRGIEVLLLSDHVDDFWVNVVQDYKKHPLKSVTRSNIDLDALNNDAKDSEQEKAADGSPDMTALIELLKKLYATDVKDVRITHKLADSPMCLCVEDGAMDIRLERFLKEQKQIHNSFAKVLEINPKHPIIRSLAIRAAKNAEDDPIIKDTALLLLDQAKIIGGMEIADIHSFSLRINKFIEKNMDAA